MMHSQTNIKIFKNILRNWTKHEKHYHVLTCVFLYLWLFLFQSASFKRAEADLCINPLKTKRRLPYLKALPYRAVNTFHLGYKNQSVYAVSGTSRCLFSDKYKTNKYSVSTMYNSVVLKLLVHHVASRL